jgi:hypothetical protein
MEGAFDDGDVLRIMQWLMRLDEKLDRVLELLEDEEDDDGLDS